MTKVIVGIAVFALFFAGAYAMILSAPPRVARSKDDRTVGRDDNANWTVEYVDSNKRPIKPVEVKPAPAVGFQWKAKKANSSNGRSVTSQPRSSANSAPNSPSVKPGG